MEAAAAPSVLVSVSEAARLKGVTKQTISEKLRRLLDEGRITVAPRGREKVFSLAAYDIAVGETTDPARLVARETAATIAGEPPPAPSAPDDAKRDPSYTKELTRKAGLEADLKAIEVAKQRGELLEIGDVQDAMARCAEQLVRDIDRLPAFADEMADIVAKKGAGGLREALKRVARELRDTLARSMTLLGEDDPAAEDVDEAA